MCSFTSCISIVISGLSDMLKPNKYMNFTLSVISISSDILKILSKNNTIKYDELVSQVIKSKGKHAKEIVLPALNFLFLIGKVEYHNKIDSIELVQ